MFKNREIRLFLIFTTLLISTNILCEVSAPKPCEETINQKKNSKQKWPEICNKYKNSVVQVLSFINVFNLSDPSKTGSEQFVGSGSGFFISDDGYMLTNFHVVNEAPVIKVRIPALGEQNFDAEIIGCNPKKDFALLKLSDSSLKTVKEFLKIDKLTYFDLGDSDKVVESDKVMTLGYPLGQRNLKSSIGNVSGRESLGETGECIQTTTPINPGNSGGPFVDETGKIVGIATLKILNTDGIAYFIPVNMIKIDLDTLYDKKVIKKPTLGIQFHSTTEETLKFLEVPNDGGVYICNVLEKSLAENAGLKKGDVIYTLNDLKVDRYGYIHPSWREAKLSIPDFIAHLKIGEIAKFKIYRNKQELEINIQIPDEEPFAIQSFYPWLEEAPDYERIGGIVVVQLTLNHISALAQAISQSGVGDYSAVLKYSKPKKRFTPRILITTIYPGSVASDVQFSVDDVIVKKVNGIKVKTIDDFRTAVLAGCKDNPDYLTIENEGGTFVALPVQKLIDEEDELTTKNYLDDSRLVAQLAEIYDKHTVTN